MSILVLIETKESLSFSQIVNYSHVVFFFFNRQTNISG